MAVILYRPQLINDVIWPICTSLLVPLVANEMICPIFKAYNFPGDGYFPEDTEIVSGIYITSLPLDEPTNFNATGVACRIGLGSNQITNVHMSQEPNCNFIQRILFT